MNKRVLEERFLEKPNEVMEELIKLLTIQEKKINELEVKINKEEEELKEKQISLSNLKEQLKTKSEEVKFLKSKIDTMMQSDNYYKNSQINEDYSYHIENKNNMSIIDLIVLNFSRYNKHAEKLVEDIIHDVLIVEDKLDKFMIYNLLFTSLAMGKDEEILKKFSSIKCELQHPSTEQKVYLLYKESLNTLEKDSIRELGNIIETHDFKYLDKSIEKRVVSEIKANMDNMQNLYYKSEKINKSTYETVSKKDKKYPIHREVRISTLEQPCCTEHSAKLNEEDICLIQYKDSTYNFISKLIHTKAYICPQCNIANIDEKELEKLKIKHGNHGFKINNEKVT